MTSIHFGSPSQLTLAQLREGVKIAPLSSRNAKGTKIIASDVSIPDYPVQVTFQDQTQDTIRFTFNGDQFVATHWVPKS